MDNQLLQGLKYLWRLPRADQQVIADFAAAYNLSFPIVQTLLSRGYTTKKQIDEFLFSSIEKDVAHTSLMKDAQKAVERIEHALKKKRKNINFW